MIKYEVLLYDIWKDEDGHYVYDTFALGKCIYTDTSKSSLCRNLGLDDPYKIDVDVNESSIYVDYDGNPYCELREVK